jgi:hypothetical protein
MTKQFDKGVETMRAYVLGLIRGWMTNSNAQQSEAAMNVLNALAGDVQIAKPDNEQRGKQQQ